MDLEQPQRRKNVQTAKSSTVYKGSSKQKASSFNWKRASGKLHIIYKLRRALARHTKTFRMGLAALTNRVNGVRMPKSQKWEREKNKIVFSSHFTRYQREFQKHMASFIIGAFSFVAALVWNDAIKETVNLIEFNSNFIFFKYVTAAIVSVVCVIAIMFLSESNKL